MRNTRAKIILALVLVAPLIWGLLWYRGEGKLIPLEIYGDQEMDGSITPWVIRDFSLIDHQGDSFTLKDLEGKIVVANFFYATCPNVCPKMNNELSLVVNKFTMNPDIVFISHSVNPATDTVEALNEYSKRFGFPIEKWRFLTGKKSEIYDLAENYYKVVATKSDGPDDFIHSTTVALIDKDHRVRGYFESMDNPLFFTNLKGAILALIKEYKMEDEKG